MQKILLIIEVACISPLIINSIPYKKLIENFNVGYFLTCCLCQSTWIALGLALAGITSFEMIPLIAILSEFIDRKINDF